MFKIWNSSKHFFPILPSFQIIRCLNREHLSRQTPSANHLHWSLVIPLLPLPQVLPFRQCYSVFFPRESFFVFFLTFFTLMETSPSRTLFSNFSQAVQSFHGHFLGLFQRWVFFFHVKEISNFRNFIRMVFFFHGYKN